MQEEEARVVEGAAHKNMWVRAREWCTFFFASRAGSGLLPALALIATGFLFARTPLAFGAYPLGLALLCSNRKQTLPCFFGVALGAATLGLRGVVWGVLYMAALLIRVLVSLPQTKVKVLPQSKEVFGELPQLQAVTALVVALAAAVYELMVSGPDRGSILFAVVMVASAPALAVLFSGFFSWGITTEDLIGRRRMLPRAHTRAEKLWMEAAVVTLLFFGVWGMKTISVFGLNLGYVLSALSALYIARRFGALRGCVAGMITAVGVDYVFAPAFGLLGLSTGALWQLGAVYAMGIGAAAGTIWSSYVGGLTGFLGTAPELWVSALVCLPLLPRLSSDAIAEEVQKERAAAEEAVRAITETEDADNRFSRLSEAFDALAHSFSSRPKTLDVETCRSVCDEICTGYCGACPNRVGCWDSEERPAAQALDMVAFRVAEGKPIVTGEMPTRLITDCACLEGILTDLRLAGARLWCRASGAAAEYPAPDYALTAALLRDASSNATEDKQSDPAAARAIRRCLSEKGIRPSVVSVRGKRMKHVVIGSNALTNKQKEAAALLGEMEGAVGCKLSPPRFETRGQVMTMETHTLETFELEVAYATRPAAGSEVSGDAVSIFRTKDGYSYLLLSDGMGTGHRAARTAGTCATFLEKMLGAGNTEETSLKLLNRMVSMQNEECTATIDLLQFDNCYGKAGFLKSGAAASYIRREGNLFRMRSRTIPLGAVAEVDAERTDFETREGDIIIMLSDGISQTSEDAPWLIELLSRPLGNNLDNAAQTILDRAVASGGGEDDMSVVLARVASVK